MSIDIRQGDALTLLREMPAGSVRCCVTSPPYWGLRDYGHAEQLGLEQTPEEYLGRLVEVFREVRRVLADDGTLWLNLGDSYAGSGMTGGTKSKEGSAKRQDRMFHGNRRDTVPGLEQKQLIGIPWRVAFSLQADGWWLRSDIIWAKPNPMPESVTDRPTKAHEYLFLLSRSQRYYYDAAAIAEPALCAGETGYFAGAKNGSRAAASGGKATGNEAPGSPRIQVGDTRNRRTVWAINSQPFSGAHFAVMPEALVEPCILAGSAPGDTVLDPFAGSGTVGVVSLRYGRRFIGIELNAEYVRMARRRVAGPLFAEEGA